MKTRENFVYIPGWMDRAQYHGFSGPDIWGRDFGKEKSFSSEVVVAHSLGSTYLLQNIDFFPNVKKIILVNPLVLRRRYFFWIKKWIMFMFKEGFFMFNPKRVYMLKFISSGTRDGVGLLRKNSPELLDKISNKEVVVIKGRNDKYFFCEQSKNLLEAKGFKVVEVEDAGHIVNKNIEKTIWGMV